MDFLKGNLLNMQKREIYLDNSATTKISDAALQKYIDVSKNIYGNPSSLHLMGYEAEKELKNARSVILDSLGAKDDTLVFTSCGSESNNLAIIGRALSKERYRKNGKIITTLGEHASVYSPIFKLREMGFNIAQISTKGGQIDFDALSKELNEDVILVSMMMVNNETGALYDLKAVKELMTKKTKDAVLHADATQSYMKVKFTKASLGADMITVSSHKIEGPKGVGALIIDKNIIKQKGISALILGGGQEGGLRSGTENVPGIAAFGIAVRERISTLDRDIAHMESLRSYLIEKLNTPPVLSEISVTNPQMHAPHILNITLSGIKSETMLHHLSSLGIYVSSGSACSSNSQSHMSDALVAYGRSASEQDSSIRVSFSPQNTKEDVDMLIEGLISGLTRLKRKR